MQEENIYGHRKKVEFFRREIAQEIAIKNHVSVLDIGCGSGWAVTRNVVFDRVSILGIDMYQPNIDYANAHFASENVRFECRKAESLAHLGNKYDVILLSDILEHVNDPEEILGVANRLLADDGVLLASIPNGFGPFEIESYISKVPILGKFSLKLLDYFIALLNKTVLKGCWKAGDTDLPYNSSSPHIHFFTYSRFEKLLIRTGFKIEKRKKLSFLSGPYSNYIFSPFLRFMRVNNALADLLPYFMVSAWCFSAKKR